jgi:hypothetical protein
VAKLQAPLVSNSPLLNEPQGGKDQLLRPLPHDQVQHDRDGYKQPARQQR